jgi:menaquinone-dependent protoporphyrinogen IX oxidase
LRKEESTVKTLVLKASPRRGGNTATLADRIADGLRSVGHTDIAEFSLNELTIRPCQACNHCLTPPHAGCVIDDGFQTIYPAFREADLVVLAAPIYWWHVCAQMKLFIDRMHPMLTFDRDHCLPTKHLVFLTAYVAEDPYGVQLAVRTFESIAGWAGMALDVIRFHAAGRHVRDCPGTLEQAFVLGRSFADWHKPSLIVPCPVEGCGFVFPDEERLAMHLVMAADEAHLEWKRRNVGIVHTLSNTEALFRKTLERLGAQGSAPR